MADPDHMTDAETELCRKTFVGMQATEITPASSYRFLTALRDVLLGAGSDDPEGKAVAFLFFVTMRSAQGAAGKQRR